MSGGVPDAEIEHEAGQQAAIPDERLGGVTGLVAGRGKARLAGQG